MIHISVDGLRPDAITALGPSNLPNFYRLRTQGAFTDNARSDYDWTVTLPNHACQLTGYPVEGTNGHNWTFNDITTEEQTLASNKGAYIPGVFDVAHDHGLRTGFFASKAKFAIFIRSWNATNGAPDAAGPDNGRNKIDVGELIPDTLSLVEALVTNMEAQPFNYVFFHFGETDGKGHENGWDISPGTPYSDAVKLMDDHLGALFTMIDGSAQLSNHTVIILTADHGGTEFDHIDPLLEPDYTIPFYVWGPSVPQGADLYALNPGSSKHPGTTRPDYADSPPPIRNGDAANLALMLLGLPPVPGSTINADQSRSVVAPFTENFQLSLIGNNQVFTFSTKSNLLYDIEHTTNLTLGSWSVSVSNILGIGGRMTNSMPHPAGFSEKFFRLHPHP